MDKMKQYMSVFKMLVRSSFYKICGLLGIMIVVESMLFNRRLGMAAMDVSYGGMIGYGLETLIERSWLSWIFGATFILISVVLCYAGCEYGSRQGYTLRRLLITEKTIFWIQALYNCCCYVILWAIQIIVLGVFCLLYMKKIDAALLSNQTIFLAFYRSEFLHSLMPLEEVNVWISNMILVMGLGISAAGFPYKQRRKKFSAEIVALVGLALVYFVQPIGVVAADVVLIGLSVTIVIELLIYVYSKGDLDEV